MESLKKAISQKSLRFLANLAEDSTEVLVAEADLAGLDSGFVQALERRDGKCVVTMNYPHVIPIMDRCGVAETRRRVATAFNSRCVADNVPLLEECVAMRHQLAQLLGYKTHAHFKLEVSMAKSPEAVHSVRAGKGQSALPTPPRRPHRRPVPLVPSRQTAAGGRARARGAPGPEARRLCGARRRV